MGKSRSGTTIHFTEHFDALHSLEELRDQLKKTRTDSYAWKLAILVGCNALNGALICALNDTASVACLTKTSAAAMLAWYEESRRHPNTKQPKQFLKSTTDLLADFRKSRELSKQVPMSASMEKDLRCAIEFRKKFTHYLPTSWRIDVIGIPRIVNSVASVACNILRTQGTTVNPIRYERKLNKRLNVVEKEIREICVALAKQLGEPIT